MEHRLKPNYHQLSRTMKRIFTILTALMLTLSFGPANAQNSKKDNDYNLQRAWEALREEKDDAKALDLVNRVEDQDGVGCEPWSITARQRHYFIYETMGASLKLSNLEV